MPSYVTEAKSPCHYCPRVLKSKESPECQKCISEGYPSKYADAIRGDDHFICIPERFSQIGEEQRIGTQESFNEKIDKIAQSLGYDSFEHAVIGMHSKGLTAILIASDLGVSATKVRNTAYANGLNFLHNKKKNFEIKFKGFKKFKINTGNYPGKDNEAYIKRLMKQKHASNAMNTLNS